MIAAHELMIGNWVEYNNNGYGEVTANTFGAGNKGKIDFIEPIPLTPAILEAAGFEKWMAGEHNEIEMVGYRKGKFDVYATEQNTFHFADNRTEVELCEIYNLHQLQNLIFALTGQELEINLSK